MNNDLALDLITKIMGWSENDDGTSTREYAWLRLMSNIKYDGYTDFRAGVRFIESLATWLKQFAPNDRDAAYEFIKKRLTYISPAELQRVIEAFVPEVVTPHIRLSVATELGIKPYEVWAEIKSAKLFWRKLRKTLFVGMSDGSRIDILRRANAGRISTEQAVLGLNIDQEKWIDLNKNLEIDLSAKPQEEKFEDVFLIDDFTASGTTFLRCVDEKWKGKLTKFNKLMCDARKTLGANFPIAKQYTLHIHHYISSDQARKTLDTRLEEADAKWEEKDYTKYKITEGLLLPPSLKLNGNDDDDMLKLCDRYYDHKLFKRREKHCREAGQTDMKRGYANCALTVVLDHNCPNNSVPLLWAETEGKDGAHRMRPLFRRRDRHG